MIRTVAVVRDALILLALVVGPPAGLLAVAGPPLPDQVPSAAVLQDWLHDPLQPRYVTVLAVDVGWLLWTACTLLIAVTIARSVRRPRLRRRGRWRCYLPGPMQSLAATLVGAAAVTSAASPAAIAAPASSSTTHVPPEGECDAILAVPASADTPAVAVTVTAPTRASAATSAPTYTVKKHDTLFDIAARRLGDGNRWPQLYHLNRGRHFPGVGGTFTNPHLIYPGWTLTLPHRTMSPGHDAATPPAPHASADPTISSGQRSSHSSGRSDRSPGVSRHHTSEPATPPSRSTPGVGDASRGSSPTSPAPSDGGASAGTTPTGSSSGASGPAAQRTMYDRGPATDDAGWIEVTGGIISVGLAAGLLSAAAVVWRRRRHRYRPTPITSATADDADLTPPLPGLTRLRHSVRRAAPHLLTAPTTPGPTVHEYVTAHAAAPSPRPNGPTGADLAGLGQLATLGVGLDGPGGSGAARAALVAALTAGTADHPHLRGRVVIPAATLAEVLGVVAVDLPATGRLTVAATFPDALATVEEEIIRRSRIVADHDAADIAALREPWTCAEPLPQLLLIADTPPEAWQARLGTAVQLGVPLNVGAVLIGAWPYGTTLTVTRDGSTDGADGQRVAVLDTAATVDMLTMLAEAHGDATPSAGPPPIALDQNRPPTASPDAPAGPSPTAPLDQENSAAEPSTRRVRARVLGRPAILDADGSPVRGLRTKALELFVYLVMHRSGATLTDIMEALWPDVTVSRAADRLSTCAANLRTTIRTITRTPAGPPDRTIEPVINTGGHYHLNPVLLDVDWWTVVDAYTTFSSAGDDDTRRAQLHTAIDAAAGHGLADDCDYEWIDTDREHVRRRLIKIHSQAATLLADSDPHTSRRLYDTACTLDPLSDELARCAMQAAARLGDTDGVRRSLARLQHDLDEAGIDIDADTEQLASDLLRTVSSR